MRTERSFDVVVVGAGAAGLMAARELALTGKKTAVLEARDRAGGRIHTITDPQFDLPVELGAEFIHGDLEPTLSLLKKAGMKHYPVKGSFWQQKDGQLQEQKDFINNYDALHKKFKELKEDISVSDFIEQYLQDPLLEELRFTLRNYVEGYYAADAARASTFALREELEAADEDQYRIEGGYVRLMDFLVRECQESGTQFFFNHPVREITWRRDEVNVWASSLSFHARKVVVTVPIGILQQEKISFVPALSGHMEAARQLGFGPVIKIILQFSEPFWKNKNFTEQKDLDQLSFIFSHAAVPTWWTYYPKDSAMITGWSAGPHARELKHRSNEDILETALDSLARIFSIEPAALRYRLKGWHVANWMEDPYSAGAYAYDVVEGAAAKKILQAPVEGTVFFAGEGLYEGPEIGTVNAALVMGREAAHQVVAAFKS